MHHYTIFIGYSSKIVIAGEIGNWRQTSINNHLAKYFCTHFKIIQISNFQFRER